MGANTAIEWAHHTFNPWRGCTKVSGGCKNCYAETMSKRNPGVLGVWGDNGTRVVASESMWREPVKWNAAAEKAGERYRVFCASLADVCEDRQELIEPRIRLKRLIESTPHLDWLLLTKRPENFLRLFYGPEWWPSNVWAGTSTENQQAADERIPHLLRVPAAIRFLSMEPLLGLVDLCQINLQQPPTPKPQPCVLPIMRTWAEKNGIPTEREVAEGLVPLHGFDKSIDPLNGEVTTTKGVTFAGAPMIHWIIVGGESGSGSRPCDIAWVRSIIDQCKAAGVACFVKQFGARPILRASIDRDMSPADEAWPVSTERFELDPKQRIVSYAIALADRKGGDSAEWPESMRVRELPTPQPDVAKTGTKTQLEQP